jgi:hypothetical protein
MVGGGKNRAGRFESAGVLEADTSGKAKRVEATLSGDLIRDAWTDLD